MSDYKYKAFISYCHADQKWATWLHRKLEAYRVPRSLVARDGLPRHRLRPIFRDRDELSSASSLSGALQEAMHASENLIVICSPDAAKSQWVNEEIKAFKQSGRGGRIQCLIVRGNPATAFPAALLSEDEPLAADIQRDGKQMSFLKIAAGMLEVPFDDLRQRELHAKHRRMVTIAGFSFAGMVLAVGLATFALISRQQAVEAREEANVQRQIAVVEAETASRIADFMVGLFRVSDPSEARGNTITARELLDQGAAEVRVGLSGQPEIQATLLHTIGQVYHSLGLYQPAREQLEFALDIRRRILPEEHPDVAATLMVLAQLERDTGRLAQAEPLYQEALGHRVTLWGENHPEVAESLNDLASLYWEQNRLEESRTLYERALRIREALFGPDHPAVAETLRGTGALAWAGSDYDRAAMLFERALDIFRAALGDDHPDVSRMMSNLAATHFMRGRYEEARVLNEEVVAINDRVLGPDHPEGIIALSNLAEVLIELGEHEQAVGLYQRALDIGENALGPDNIELGWPLDGLGTLYQRIGDYDSARTYFERALAVREATYGPEHMDVADTLEGFAELLREAGDLEEALGMEARAQEIRQRNAATLSADSN